MSVQSHHEIKKLRDLMKMKYEMIRSLLLFLLAGFFMLSCAAVADDPSNMTGYYEIRSNVENASVYFNGEFAGNIEKGSLLIQAELSNRPVNHKLMIQAPGYTTYNETIVQAPKPGKNNIIRGP